MFAKAASQSLRSVFSSSVKGVSNVLPERAAKPVIDWPVSTVFKKNGEKKRRKKTSDLLSTATCRLQDGLFCLHARH